MIHRYKRIHNNLQEMGEPYWFELVTVGQAGRCRNLIFRRHKLSLPPLSSSSVHLSCQTIP